jgi:hypothetical protein
MNIKLVLLLMLLGPMTIFGPRATEEEEQQEEEEMAARILESSKSIAPVASK